MAARTNAVDAQRKLTKFYNDLIDDLYTRTGCVRMAWDDDTKMVVRRVEPEPDPDDVA